MSRRRSAPRWTCYAACGVAVVGLAVAVVLAVQLFSGTLKLLRTGGEASERDPQFAEPAESVTRPPELDQDGNPVDLGEDPSLGWVYEDETPVDKTAEELSREAAAGN